ncbi:MAG: M20/M25/M40 family metallo-hydrolase, partial [Pontibacter sp.]|nr:M20/M25/M40 family metallo-hydrolase [Pontibacter sp.]
MRSFFCVVAATLIFAASAAASPADSAAVNKRTAAAARLAEAITFKTVSALEEEKFAYAEFIKLHAYLQEAFPLVHQHLQREVINGYSLLYTWHGSQPKAKGVLMSAHMDVVPVEQASEQQWEQGPFAGVVQDGYVWGRGSMDDKYRVTAILEAVEQLLAQGYRPTRTVYLAFGHDEEVGGYAGAGMISRHLQQQGVQLEAVFDEGLAVAEGVVPGLTEPVALVGTAAKGNLNLRLTVEGSGGHSSVPPSDTPISVLSQALHQLHQNPFEAHMIPTTRETIAMMADKLGGKYRFAMRHYGLFRKQILKLLAKDRATDALIRTKLVPTILEAGEKANVLPT